MMLEQTNFALNKPTLQSSISKWSRGATRIEDAAIGANGDIESDNFFHTDHELAPYWQVDLELRVVILKVIIYNRRQQSDRLRHFTILFSLTGESDSWIEVYFKKADMVCGQFNNAPYIAELAKFFITRFVRVRQDSPGYMHFRKCQVFGYVASGEYQESFRNQHISYREQERWVKFESDRRLGLGRVGRISLLDGHKVFVDTDKYSDKIVFSLFDDTYEGRERRVVKAPLSANDRVLKVGSAIGVVSMAIADVVGPRRCATASWAFRWRSTNATWRRSRAARRRRSAVCWGGVTRKHCVSPTCLPMVGRSERARGKRG